jgi:hypothetical protein
MTMATNAIFSLNAYGAGGRWVLVGADTSYNWITNYSTNGTSWTAGTSPLNNPQGLVSNGTRWVMIGSGTTANQVASSTNGITWTVGTLEANASWWGNVVWTGTKFVTAGGGKSAISYDGLTWTVYTNSAVGSNLTYGNGYIVITRFSTGAVYSVDGITWTAFSMPTSSYWTIGAYGVGKFVIPSQSGATTGIAYASK